MKRKAGSLSRSTKSINPSPDISQKKRERSQMSKIRNEKGEVTTDIIMSGFGIGVMVAS